MTSDDEKSVDLSTVADLVLNEASPKQAKSLQKAIDYDGISAGSLATVSTLGSSIEKLMHNQAGLTRSLSTVSTLSSTIDKLLGNQASLTSSLSKINSLSSIDKLMGTQSGLASSLSKINSLSNPSSVDRLMRNQMGLASSLAKINSVNSSIDHTSNRMALARSLSTVNSLTSTIDKLLGAQTGLASSLSKINSLSSADKLLGTQTGLASSLSKINSLSSIDKFMGTQTGLASSLSKINSLSSIDKLLGAETGLANSLSKINSLSSLSSVERLMGSKSVYTNADAISKLMAAKGSYGGVDAVSKLMGLSASVSSNAAQRRAIHVGATAEWSATLAAMSVAYEFPSEIAALGPELDELSSNLAAPETELSERSYQAIEKICDDLIYLLQSVTSPFKRRSLQKLIEVLIIPLLIVLMGVAITRNDIDQAAEATRSDVHIEVGQLKLGQAKDAGQAAVDEKRLEEKVDHLIHLLQENRSDRLYVVRRAVPLCSATAFCGHRIATLLPGEEVELVMRGKKWIFVRALTGSGSVAEGWVLKKYLRRI